MTTIQDLVKIRARALRSRIWFKALSRVERAVVDLTIKCVKNVRSSVLAETISTILDKILHTLEENFVTRAETVGQEIAEKLSAVAKSWGNKACSTWKCDKRFIRFLGVNALNT